MQTDSVALTQTNLTQLPNEAAAKAAGEPDTNSYCHDLSVSVAVLLPGFSCDVLVESGNILVDLLRDTVPSTYEPSSHLLFTRSESLPRRR